MSPERFEEDVAERATAGPDAGWPCAAWLHRVVAEGRPDGARRVGALRIIELYSVSALTFAT